MSSVDIYIIVEGKTELTFVRDVLAPAMAYNKIYLYPPVIGKLGHKGGDVRFDRVVLDIGNRLKERKNSYITTMFDYFRIDSKWPGRDDVKKRIQNGTTLTAIAKAELLETAMYEEIARIFPDCDSKKRFIPYIAMHEFEALLFSDVTILEGMTDIPKDELEKICGKGDNPEEINDDPKTAPSKRLEALSIKCSKKGYRKAAMGPTVSDEIGIPTMRNRCPHFNDWLTKLENLASGRS